MPRAPCTRFLFMVAVLFLWRLGATLVCGRGRLVARRNTWSDALALHEPPTEQHDGIRKTCHDVGKDKLGGPNVRLRQAFVVPGFDQNVEGDEHGRAVQPRGAW